jgi:cullin 3
VKQTFSGMEEMKRQIEEYVRHCGRYAFDHYGNEPEEWTRSLLNLKFETERWLCDIFEGDPTWIRLLHQAMEYAVNYHPQCHLCLSLYIDSWMKHRRREEMDPNRPQMIIMVNHVINLFRHFRDKDVFEMFYKQHLMRRLLIQKYDNDPDREEEMILISRLKQECGRDYVLKLEHMLQDVQMVSSIQAAFREESHLHLPFELSVTVLTASCWPITLSDVPSCRMPLELLTVCNAFEAFYKQRHQGRILKWKIDQGSVDFKLNLRNHQYYYVHVTSYQMLVLLLFEDDDGGCETTEEGISYQDILHRTGLSSEDLNPVLLSLTYGKYRLLLKQPSLLSTHISETDRFFFNHHFSASRIRIRLPAVTTKTTLCLPSTSTSSVPSLSCLEEDRRMLIEATLVRQMKVQRVMAHGDLMAQVIEQIRERFTPDPSTIKKCIETLIERDFIERDPLKP